MPYAPHHRLTLRGEYTGNSSAVEQWQVGINCLTGNADQAVTTQGMLDNAAVAAASFYARAGTAMSQFTRLTEVKLAAIGADGKYTGDPLIAGLAVIGAKPARTFPPQVALAISLVTERRGASGRGRFYLPAPAQVSLDAGWVLPDDVVTEVRFSVAQFLSDLSDEAQGSGNIGDNLYPVVASTKGFNTRVEAVRVGHALDTVRSRRASLVEAYTAPASTNPGA